MTAEEWRPVIGAPGYFVSNLGRVRSEVRKRPIVMTSNEALPLLLRARGGTDPVRVAVVRPNGKPWINLTAQILVAFLNAWIFMVCAPGAFHWHPGYGQSLLAIVAVRALLVQSSPDALSWTWAPRGKK